MRKTTSKRTVILAFVMICLIIKPVLGRGASIVPSTIRVGLRSAYSNKPSIEIKSTELKVGYGSDDLFIPQGTLLSNSGFMIRPNQKQYYGTKDKFYTYTEAAFGAVAYKEEGIGAVVAYSWPGIWQVYLEENLVGTELVKNTGLEIMVQDGQGQDLLFCNNVGVETAFAGKNKAHSFDLTDLEKGSYRGWFEFKRKINTITAINVVDHQDYLYGVIAAEMPPSWHMEALKAQAVAARSMSIYQGHKYLADGYNVCDTIYTQVYKGLGAETTRTSQAVDETKGMVATYQGKIAETVFFSTSGGHTEDSQYVWGSPIAYLKAVADPYEVEPEGKPWTRTITLSEIDQCLANQKISIGQAKGVKINGYTPAGRVNELEIIGTSGSHKIVLENIRNFFSSTKDGSLRSRMFTITNGAATPITTSKPLQELSVYKGDEPKYLIGASGKVQAIGDSVMVEGQGGKVTYGGTSNSGGQSAYGDIVLSGKGYGHGVGMSQSGARGMANSGYTFDEIIEYYYQGVRVER